MTHGNTDSRTNQLGQRKKGLASELGYFDPNDDIYVSDEKGLLPRAKGRVPVSYWNNKAKKYFTVVIEFRHYSNTTSNELRPFVSRKVLRELFGDDEYVLALFRSSGYDLNDDNCQWSFPLYRVLKMLWSNEFGILAPKGNLPGDKLDCHHRNENPLDNRFNNLEVMTVRDHAEHHGFKYVDIPIKSNKNKAKDKDKAKDNKRSAEYWQDYWHKVFEGIISRPTQYGKRPKRDEAKVWVDYRTFGLPYVHT